LRVFLHSLLGAKAQLSGKLRTSFSQAVDVQRQQACPWQSLHAPYLCKMLSEKAMRTDGYACYFCGNYAARVIK